MNNESSNSIKDSVARAIEAGKVKMRPRWHFLLSAGLLFVGTILVVFTLVYLSSFAIFIFQQTPGPGPGMGARGLGVYLTSLPWIIILIAIIFLIILELLVRRYSFAYRKPLLYTILGIIVLIFLVSLLVAQTPFHKNLYDRAERDNLPFGNKFYRNFGPRPHHQPGFDNHEINPETFQ
jgi:hypothetical protein